MSVIVRLARDVRTAMDQRLLPLGVTSQQAGVLVQVKAGNRSPRRLADLLGTDSAGMSRLLDRLEQKGLIERRADSADRRALVVHLTSSGEDLVPDAVAAFGGLAKVMTKGIAADDADRTLAVLSQMIDNLGPGTTAPEH